MYCGVPITWPNSVNSVASVSDWSHRLGDAEVDHLGHRLAVVQCDQHVRRLDVAMNDALLVGVLDGLADRDEQLQPLSRRVSRWSSQYSVSGMPFTSSMTK